MGGAGAAVWYLDYVDNGMASCDYIHSDGVASDGKWSVRLLRRRQGKGQVDQVDQVDQG